MIVQTSSTIKRVVKSTVYSINWIFLCKWWSIYDWSRARSSINQNNSEMSVCSCLEKISLYIHRLPEFLFILRELKSSLYHTSLFSIKKNNLNFSKYFICLERIHGSMKSTLFSYHRLIGMNWRNIVEVLIILSSSYFHESNINLWVFDIVNTIAK